MSEPTFESIRSAAIDALSAGDHNSAFRQIRQLICYQSPFGDQSTSQFVDCMSLFEKVAVHFAPQEFTSKIGQVAANPDDTESLFNLGYDLYEESLFDVAAMILTRANHVAPGQPGIIAELACALEHLNLCESAFALFRENEQLTKRNFLLAYQYAFNAVMSGNLAIAEEQMPVLDSLSESPEQEMMKERIGKFLSRVDRICRVTSLDENDLRGWQFVINETLLLHLSPHGYPDPMRGRYAWVQDQFNDIYDGFRNLQIVLDLIDFQPAKIFALNDRSSQITAFALSRFFQVPIAHYTPEVAIEPGIIVAYDISNTNLEGLECISERQPNQLLYSHCTSWTDMYSISPDITYRLHQANNAPWDSQLKINPETDQPEQSEPDDRAIPELAVEILQAQQTSEPDETPALKDEFVIATLGQLASGTRERGWNNSPVKSARFT